jgi:hypothetical protein
MLDHALRLYLRYLASTTRPIVLGPFRSELGFEALYWLPFLAWALKHATIPPERCIALSRGGMGHLYPAAHHVDLYALRGVDAVRLENQVDYQARRELKQHTVTAWDRSVAREAVERVHRPGTRHHLLHPAWMYRLFRPYWDERVGMPLVARRTDYAPPPIPALPHGLTLPPKFVAVRFYERATLPMQAEVQAAVRTLVGRIAQHLPVVVLAQPHFVDDHTDLPLSGPNILVLPPAAPEQNLVLQAGVLARCQAFVGTYGGLAQWALLYRRPTLSLYLQFGGTALAHRMLSHALSAQLKVPFEMLDMAAWPLWETAFGVRAAGLGLPLGSSAAAASPSGAPYTPGAQGTPL